MGKRLLTLCSWRSETSQLSTTVKDEATVDALWMCVHLARSMLYRQIGYPLGEIYHIGVGFYVARSTVVGNAKASDRWTGDGTAVHAFFMFYQTRKACWDQYRQQP